MNLIGTEFSPNLRHCSLFIVHFSFVIAGAASFLNDK
jgi:hypothetical protein